MFALALSGSVTATEQQPFDAVLYEQIRAEAIALATKVDRGEMSREDATLQLVQMQLTTMERNSRRWKTLVRLPLPPLCPDTSDSN
jgi:hypothetical protein